MRTVAIKAADEQNEALLRKLFDSCGLARTVMSWSELPPQGMDELEQQLAAVKPEVLVVEISPNNAGQSVGIIGMLHADMPEMAIIAIGDTADKQRIVAVMQAGAREYIERPPSLGSVRQAFWRLDAKHSAHGKIITVLNAKGGCGATTTAVNLSMGLREFGKVVLVDLAPIGTASLHLNVRPKYTVANLLERLDRLDDALLQAFVTETRFGVDLFAGTESPLGQQFSPAQIQMLLLTLASKYEYVIVDLSSRLDPLVQSLCSFADTTLLVCENDLVSLLWNAARVQSYLGATSCRDKIRLVLNRVGTGTQYSDADAEAAAEAKLFCKIPSDGWRVAEEVNSGSPVILQRKSDIAACFLQMAAQLS